MRLGTAISPALSAARNRSACFRTIARFAIVVEEETGSKFRFRIGKATPSTDRMLVAKTGKRSGLCYVVTP